MATLNRRPELVTFLPGLAPEDPAAFWWLRQATVRLRREVCWLWHERAGQAGEPDKLPLFRTTVPLGYNWIPATRYCELKVTLAPSIESSPGLPEF